MALPSSAPRTPTTVRVVTVILNSLLIRDDETGEYNDEAKRSSYSLTILDQSGDQMRPFSGNLFPHLTQEQLDWLIPFMDEMRTLAEATLPTSS